MQRNNRVALRIVVLILALLVAGVSYLLIEKKSRGDGQNLQVVSSQAVKEFTYIFDGSTVIGMLAYPTGAEVRWDPDNVHNEHPSIKVSLPAKLQWAGAVIELPQVDLSPLRAGGVLTVWVKGDKGGETFAIGLGSSAVPGRTVYSSLPLGRTLTKEWQEVLIPLRDFADHGTYWDGKASVPAEMDWSKISAMSVNVGDTGNKPIFINIGAAGVRAIPQ